jgi:hypothetical protein
MKLNPAGAGIKETDSFVKTKEVPTQIPTKSAERQSVGRIVDIKLNDVIDSRGVVVKHKDIYSPTVPEINVSAYIENAVKGGKVSADLVYSRTGDIVGPVSNGIVEDGDRISNFSFSKPTKGWPEGNYRVIITLSSGESKSVTFEVKE